MPVAGMYGQNETLLALGLGVLFLVLILQFVLLRKVGRIISILGLDNVATAVQGPETMAGERAPVLPDAAGNARLTAAITAAIAEYRKSN